MPVRPNIPRARVLRRGQTEAERRLWSMLRDRRLGGFKFVRQFPLGPYIVDFCCRKAMLIVEADGGQHSGSARDAARDGFLVSRGYRVLRFWNADVLARSGEVAETIFARLAEPGATSPHPASGLRPSPPSPLRGEGVGSVKPAPLPSGGREGPAAERREGEGRYRSEPPSRPGHPLP